MDILVSVTGAQVAGGSRVNASLSIATSTGVQVGADIPVDFAASVTQMNAAIRSQVVAVLNGVGVPATGSDRIRVVGGFV